jgi:hypothetical protein
VQKGTQKAKDTELVTRFTEWYCKAHHDEDSRLPLESSGVDAGIYGSRTPLLCEDCAIYARYSELRTESCPHNPKPFCTDCPNKCYKEEMVEYARKVMRYSGPRSLRTSYCLRAIQHILASRRSGME